MSAFDSLGAEVKAACLDLFGDTVTYTPMVGSPFLLIAKMDISEQAQLIYGGGASGTARTTLSNFPAPPKKGDELSFGGVAYVVSFDPTRKLSAGGIPENENVTLVLRRI